MPKPRMKDRESLQGELILPTRIMVMITRDMTEVIPKIIFEHEYDILAEMHTPENIALVEDPLVHGVLIGTPEQIAAARKISDDEAKRRQKVSVLYFHTIHPTFVDEHGAHTLAPLYVGDEMGRLRNAYGMNEEKKTTWLDLAYPHEQNFIDACGGAFNPDSPKKLEKRAA